MSAPARREDEPETSPGTKISRRAFFEYAAGIGGVLTTAAASFDGIVADISITNKLIKDKKKTAT